MKNNKKLPNFQNKFFLAPMAGVTDPGFRVLCRELGAGLTYTDLISTNSIVAKDKLLKKDKENITQYIQFSEDEKPRAIQLFGRDLDMAKKAMKIVEKHFDIIDYNMGCPSKNIAGQGCGAMMLKEPEICKEIIKILAKSKKPGSIKIRLGIDEKNKEQYKTIGKIADDEGISMITLHARTMKQGYSGQADWKSIKELKRIVSVPVVGNGDINSPEKAIQMIKETNCDYAMIGRAARDNPFIFKQIKELEDNRKYEPIGIKERADALKKYIEYSNEFRTKFSVIKTHASSLTTGITGGRIMRTNITKAKNVEEIIQCF